MDRKSRKQLKAIKPKRKFGKRDLMGWLVILPPVILFAFFVWEPLLESVRLSLYSARGVELQEFVGLQNYIEVFNDVNFKAAFLNTFKYIGWSLIIGFVVPIILAIFISETVRLKSFFRFAVYLPNIMPGMAVALLWVYFFKPGDTGVLNILLGKCGIAPSAWLNNAALVIPLIVIALTWKGAGSTSLIYMAGISGINPEYYEAAAIDGAGIGQRIFHVTIPCILSLGKTMLILQVIAVFQILYEPLVLTNGGPNNASLSIMLLVYKYAFNKYDYPNAAALSVVICIVLILLSGLYMALTRKKNDE
ncbi:carbohydrate ABC transporter permease [Eubacterium sp.]|uniref:carbohydrate ABC transporter permease n=1 Tax=Eubacterium sp. TaxID=142586 RepID=UPI00262F816F|nr:sugar ABC transporter permease [uncultured Eubacterium sp.]